MGANEETLSILVRLKDQATQEFARLTQTVRRFGTDTSVAASVAELKFNALGAAASSVGSLVGGTTGFLLALGGRGATAIHQLALAFKGPLGLTAAIGAAGAAALAIQPYVEALGEKFEKALPALNERFLKLLSPANAKEIGLAFKEAAGGEDLAKRTEAFNKALTENAAALERAGREAKIYGTERIKVVQTEIQTLGDTLLKLQDNLDNKDLGQALKLGDVAAQLRAAQRELKALQEAQKAQERFQQDQEDAGRQWEEDEKKRIELLKEEEKAQREVNRELGEAQALYAREHDLVLGLRGAFRELGDESQRWGKAGRAAVLDVADSLAGEGTEALLAWGQQAESERKIFKRVTASILKDIARIIIQTLILKAVQAGISGLGGLFEGGGGSDRVYDGSSALTAQQAGFEGTALGGVVSRAPARTHHAAGAILTKPTMVGFSRGGAAAIGGEAGEEAYILPLRRDRNGRLGVSGAGTSITINYHSSAVSTAEEARMIQRNAETIAAVVSRQLRQDGKFRGAVRTA